MLLIADLSNNNGAVDFARLAKVPGMVGVYLKATEGHAFVDGTFSRRRREANLHGLRVGAYHFARHGDSLDEARHFAAVVRTIDRRDLRPALDAEVGGFSAWEQWAREWVAATSSRLGTCPVIYSDAGWLVSLHARIPIGCGLWLATWGRNDGVEHPYSVPAPWRKAVLHQFTSNARLPGVAGRCDLSSGAKLRPLLAHPVTGLL